MHTKAITVAALLSLAMPAAVMAQAGQSVDASGNVNVSAEGDGMGMSGPRDMQIGINADFDTFMQSFTGADYTSATSELDAATKFSVVRLSSLENADAARVKSGIDAHRSDIAALHQKLQGNERAMALLDAQGLSASDVIWIETGADGDATLYVNDLDTM